MTCWSRQQSTAAAPESRSRVYWAEIVIGRAASLVACAFVRNLGCYSGASEEDKEETLRRFDPQDAYTMVSINT